MIAVGVVKYRKTTRLNYVPIVVYALTVKVRKGSVKNKLSAKDSEIRGLREVIRTQSAFIFKIKKLFAEYTGESKNWPYH